MKTNYLPSIFTAFIMLFITVSDIQALSITCPSDLWVSCTDELWDLSGYPNATYTDYNGTHDAGDPVVVYHLNSCDIGTIERTWTVSAYGHTKSCTQVFYVEGGTFGYNNITWPLSGLELFGCNPDTDPNSLPDGYGAPTYYNTECTMIALSNSDQIFTISATCRKLLRTWKVMNWCTYDEYTGQGLWTYTQVIKLIDNEIPDPNYNKEITQASNNCKDAFVNVPVFKVDPSTCGGLYTIYNNSIYAEYHNADASGIYPKGTTKVKYTVHYGCGKKAYYYVNVTVLDTKKPQPYCYAALNMVLMGIDNDNDGVNDEGMVEVWAKDLDYGSFHSCPSHYPLKISFSKDPKDNVRTFTCNEVGLNTVEMWVTDRYNNQSFCFIELDIQNNGANIENCEPPSTIVSAAGYITTAVGEYIHEVEVNIAEMTDSSSIDSILYSAKLMSDRYGYYEFEDLAMHLDYELTCDKEIDLHKYVNTDDVRALYQHIVGRKTITDPYLLIAADIDENQIIDRKDLYAMYYFAHGTNPSLGTDKTHFIVPSNNNLEDINNYYDNDMISNTIITDVSENMLDLGFKIVIKGDLFSTRVNTYLRDNKTTDAEILSYINNSINNIEISPNPFNESFDIRLDQYPKSKVNVTIRDTQGKKVYHNTFSANRELKIYLDNSITGGLYYYNIIYENKIHTGKIIKI